jgi:hypothetical protein
VKKNDEIIYFEVEKVDDINKSLTWKEVGRGNNINLSKEIKTTNDSYKKFLDVFKK